MDAGNVEPLLFTAWLRAFAEAVFVGQLGDAGKDYWNLHSEVIENVLTHYPEWCAISTVAGVGASFRGSSQSGEGRGRDEQALIPAGTQPNGCDALLSATLDSALAGLRETYGPDMATWQWGRAHIAKFPNAVFSRIPVLRDWIDVTIPTSGGSDTVNRGSMTIRDDEHPYEHRARRRLAHHYRSCRPGLVADDRGARANRATRSRRISRTCCDGGGISTISCPAKPHRSQP